MAGVNKVILVGNLGRDPEIRYSQQGTAIVNFSIATSEEWFDKNTNQKQERTEWHRVVVFGKIAEVCEKYLSKGRQVYVEGKLRTSTYEKEGQTHYSTDVVAQTVQFLGGRQEGGYQNGGGGYQQGGYQQDNAQGGYQQNMGGQPAFQGQTSPGAPSGMQGGPIPEPDDDIPF
ncbi:MAG: single-stranded DNA-binding protein [Desulfobacteraceae bacterium]|nr:MAG: single-stranded DNA-binding protein [Desulfobacteraceae bacterium]